MRNESTHYHLQPGPDGPTFDSARTIVFERLIDQLAPGRGQIAPDVRAARRLCGRWLLLRRADRRLSRAEVAERSGLSAGAIELLELGLLDCATGPDEGWLRLGLILEQRLNNDLARVTAAIRIARGCAEHLDEALLAELEAEIVIPEEERALAERPAVPEITQELLDILAALKALGAPMTAYQVKKWVREYRGKSWNPAELPQIMGILAGDSLISRTEGRPSLYALTENGAELLALAEERASAREAARRAQAAIATLDHQLLDFAGRLHMLPGRP
jgi:transcriptional regulator with XRE-family HTH domain